MKPPTARAGNQGGGLPGFCVNGHKVIAEPFINNPRFDKHVPTIRVIPMLVICQSLFILQKQHRPGGANIIQSTFLEHLPKRTAEPLRESVICQVDALHFPEVKEELVSPRSHPEMILNFSVADHAPCGVNLKEIVCTLGNAITMPELYKGND